jgi:hypothetical protein
MSLVKFAVTVAVFAVLSGWFMTATNLGGFPDTHIWIGCGIGWAVGMLLAAGSANVAKYS